MKRNNSIPAHHCAEDIEQLLTDLWEYFDGRADADDEGPNEAMKFLIRIDQQLARLKRNNVKDISETNEGKAVIALYNVVSQKFLS